MDHVTILNIYWIIRIHNIFLQQHLTQQKPSSMRWSDANIKLLADFSSKGAILVSQVVIKNKTAMYKQISIHLKTLDVNVTPKQCEAQGIIIRTLEAILREKQTN